MVDVVDMAGEIEAEHIASGVRRAIQPIPAGVAGECDECGEDMPRLVDGRCGYCRDGRLPPIDRPVTARSPLPATETREDPASMSNPPPSADRRQISFAAKGAVLREIEKRASKGDLPLGQIAIDLIEAGMQRVAAPTASAMTELSAEQLLGALLERVRRDEAQPDLVADLAAATARADAAERKLSALREALAS